MRPPRREPAPWLLLPVLAAALLVFRALSYHDIPEWDIATYALVAQELLHGQSLYVDAWDMKPPAVFYTYAAIQMFLGTSLASVFFLSALTAVGTLVCVDAIARRQGRSAALVASLIFVAICLEPLTGANLPNTESFINLFLSLAWLILLRIESPRRAWLWALLAGACAAWATMYKHVAIAPAGLLAIAHFAVPPVRITRRAAMVQALVFLGTIVLGWLALGAWFLLTDRGEVFWQTVFVYPRFYAGSMPANLVASLTPAGWERAPMSILWPLVLLCLAGLAVKPFLPRVGPIIAAEPPRFAVMLGAMLVGAQIAVALPGQFNGHYFQLWYPALAVGAGCASANLLRLSPRRPWLSRLLVGTAIAALVAPQLSWFALPIEQWPAKRYGKLFMDARTDILTATGRLGPKDDLYIWGDEPWLYFAADRRARYAGLWKMHCLDGPVADRLTHRTLEQLKAAPPALFIFWVEPSPGDHPIVTWALENYEPMPGTPVYPLLFHQRRTSISP